MLFFYGGHLVMRSKRCAVQNQEITLRSLLVSPPFFRSQRDLNVKICIIDP